MQRTTLLCKSRRIGAAFIMAILPTVGLVHADDHYSLDNKWERARERLQLLEGQSNPYTIKQLEQVGIQEGWTCLEAGAGFGTITRWLADQVGPEGQVDALDMETRFLDEINKPNVNVLKQNLVTDPLPQGKYDFIFTRYVLMHIPEREDIIKSFMEALKPGGILMVEDFVLLSPKETYRHSIDDDFMNVNMQKVFASLSQAKSMSLETGYENIFYFEKTGFTDLDAHIYAPVARGLSPEAKTVALTLGQWTPVLVDNGHDKSTIQAIRDQFHKPGTIFWGLPRTFTTGRKPL